MIRTYVKKEVRLAKTRPIINLDLVYAIKAKFPEETCKLGIAETIEWSMRTLMKKAK